MTTVLVLALAALLLGGLACVAVARAGRGGVSFAPRALVLVVIGLVVGETVALLVLTGPVEAKLRDDAARAVATAPSVREAQAGIDEAVAARAALDTTVTEATDRRDQALVVARCEYRPRPGCPPTTITGDPGQGPETRTANQRLSAAQTDLDRATAARAAATPAADARVARARADLDSARNDLLNAEPGLGARWLAMNRLSLPATALRIAIDLVAVALALLPLLIRRWRGETVGDIRHEQELESERIAAAAQLAIDRRAHAQRVELAYADDQATRVLPSLAGGAAALHAAGFEPVEMTARRYVREVPAVSHHRKSDHSQTDEFLPIAAAAEAASLRRGRQPGPDDSPTGPIPVTVEAELEPEPDNLPAPLTSTLPVKAGTTAPATVGGPGAEVARVADRKPNPFVPPIVDDAARTVLGFVRPLVPTAIARVLPVPSRPAGTSVQQSYEEVEEVTFAMRRTRKVVVGSTEKPTE